jgi:replicative DNA helicase
MTSYDPLTDIKLPSDVDSERIVMGAVILAADVCTKGEAEQYLDSMAIDVQDFFLDSHRRIFAALRDLRAECLPLEFQSLIARLRDNGELERVGGSTYVSGLTHGIPASDPNYYAKRVKSKALQRACVRAGNAISTQALEAESGEAAVEYAERTLIRLTEGGESGEGILASVGEVADTYLAELERTQGLPPEGVRTGLRDLDDVLISLEPETLTIVGARPSQGKSAFGLTVGLNDAEAGVPVGIFSLEMPKQQLIQRLLAMISKVSLYRLRKREIWREDWPKLHAAKQHLDDLPLFIDDTRGLTAPQVCARMRRMKQQKGIELTIVDFLTRLKFNNKRDLRHEVGDAAKYFKDVSGELRIPVIALSQLSRASTTGTVRRPQLSDLRESGNLEEDSDTVVFVHREEMYQRTDANRGIAELIVAKQRQGSAPEIVQAMFNGELVRFDNLAYTNYH